jgi:hypothetical protein
LALIIDGLLLKALQQSLSAIGTLETCRMTRRMSANRGRPEVSGARST